MLEVTNSNLIHDSKALVNVVSDATKLADEILIQNVDRFETGLKRTVTRIVSALCGYVTSMSIPCLMAMDAEKDQEKIRLIQRHRDLLNKIASPDPKEQKAIDFQKQICENKETYTRTAQLLKIMTAVSTFALSCSPAGYKLLFAPETQLNAYAAPIRIASHTASIGMLVSFMIWCCGFALHNENRKLAQHAKADLAETS